MREAESRQGAGKEQGRQGAGREQGGERPLSAAQRGCGRSCPPGGAETPQPGPAAQMGGVGDR